MNKTSVLCDMLRCDCLSFSNKKKMIMHVAHHWRHIPKATASTFEPFQDNEYFFITFDYTK